MSNKSLWTKQSERREIVPRSISIHAKLAKLYKYRPPYMNIFFQTTINKLNISEKTTLLDLCCGRGELASRFSPFSDNIFGIDGSAEMLKNKIEKKNITYFLSDINAETISLPDKVDTIVVGSAMHWLEKNSLQSMINTNLKKNGKFFAAHTHLELSEESYYQHLKNLNIQYGFTSKVTQKKQIDFFGKEKMYYCGFQTIDNIRVTSTVTFDLEWFFYNRLTYLYQDKFRKNVMANLEAYKTEFFEVLSPFLENGKLKAKLLNTGIIYGQKS